MRARFVHAVGVLLLAPAPLTAQLLNEPAGDPGVAYGEPITGQFRVGVEVTAARGAVRDCLAMVATPLPCAEQQVRVVREDISPAVAKLDYRSLPGGEARQLLVRVPFLARGQTARAVVTYQVTTRPILPPAADATAGLSIPRRVPRALRRFVSVSPYIESRDRRVRDLAREVLAEAPEGATDWRRVELLYDHVLQNIAYVEGPDTSAVTTLKAGSADCHGRSALFAALCRASGVPARIVWVQGHCFAEFYLEDAGGRGRWYPIESAGSRAFGEMPLGRVILQKGDNFRIPERPKDRLRYATDWAYVPPGKGQPKVRFIREPA